MCKLTTYCDIYKIPRELVPLMEKVPRQYHYLFHSKKIIYTGERNIILTTGFYSGNGMNSKRVDVTPFITQACVMAKFRFSAYNDAVRGGVKGQKVKIFF